METRSSPSLEQLHGLARQADINDEDILSLSKPALFWHLRSNYDYDRLERAHGSCLKIGDGNGGSSSNSNNNRKLGHSDDTNPAAPGNKRVCRTSRGGGSSSRAASREHQNLPPASIFVQTRSRTRMLAARDGGGGSGDSGVEPSAIGPENAPLPQGQARTTATACQRTRRLPASGRGSSSRGKVTASTGANTDNGGGGSVSDVDPKRPSSAEASESMLDSKRNRGGGGGGGSKGKGKAKAKAEANGSGNGVSKSRGRTRNSRGAQVSSARAKGSVSRERGEGKDDDSGRPNVLDPIMLVEVGEHHYRFVRPNGRNVMYNLDSLVDYFISTGDFLEPETRLPFSDDELRAIDAKVKAAGLSKPSVLEAKRNPSRYTEQKFQQDALVGLERMLSELVTSMLKVVEELDREEGEIRLVMEIFPPFADLFKQIWAADRAFARQCMQHYTSWLQGPPNRPTEDEMGFLDIIVGFLNQLQECEGNSSLGF